LSKKQSLRNITKTNEIREGSEVVVYNLSQISSSINSTNVIGKENIQPQFSSSINYQNMVEINQGNKKCPFCAKSLPNPLLEKIRLLLRKIGMQNGECKVRSSIFV